MLVCEILFVISKVGIENEFWLLDDFDMVFVIMLWLFLFKITVLWNCIFLGDLEGFEDSFYRLLRLLFKRDMLSFFSLEEFVTLLDKLSFSFFIVLFWDWGGVRFFWIICIVLCMVEFIRLIVAIFNFVLFISG